MNETREKAILSQIRELESYLNGKGTLPAWVRESGLTSRRHVQVTINNLKASIRRDW